jgi:hypothetical protein
MSTVLYLHIHISETCILFIMCKREIQYLCKKLFFPTRGTFGNIFFNLSIVKDRNFHQFTYTETYVSCVDIFRQIIGLVMDWTFQQWRKLHKYQQTTQINGHNNVNDFMNTWNVCFCIRKLVKISVYYDR